MPSKKFTSTFQITYLKNLILKIDRISYQKVFPVSAYCTERIGLEASLDVNDNPETELNHLKIMVEELHKATIAELDQYRGNHLRSIEEIIPVSNKSPLEAMTEAINSCEEIKVLETYRLMAKSSPELQAVYDAKQKELEK